MKTKMKDSKKPKKGSPKNMKQALADAVDLLDEYRLSIVYLNFDVEATKRERDYWKYKAGGK